MEVGSQQQNYSSMASVEYSDYIKLLEAYENTKDMDFSFYETNYAYFEASGELSDEMHHGISEALDNYREEIANLKAEINGLRDEVQEKYDGTMVGSLDKSEADKFGDDVEDRIIKKYENVFGQIEAGMKAFEKDITEPVNVEKEPESSPIFKIKSHEISITVPVGTEMRNLGIHNVYADQFGIDKNGYMFKDAMSEEVKTALSVDVMNGDDKKEELLNKVFSSRRMFKISDPDAMLTAVQKIIANDDSGTVEKENASVCKAFFKEEAGFIDRGEFLTKDFQVFEREEQDVPVFTKVDNQSGHETDKKTDTEPESPTAEAIWKKAVTEEHSGRVFLIGQIEVTGNNVKGGRSLSIQKDGREAILVDTNKLSTQSSLLLPRTEVPYSIIEKAGLMNEAAVQYVDEGTQDSKIEYYEKTIDFCKDAKENRVLLYGNDNYYSSVSRFEADLKYEKAVIEFGEKTDIERVEVKGKTNLFVRFEPNSGGVTEKVQIFDTDHAVMRDGKTGAEMNLSTELINELQEKVADYNHALIEYSRCDENTGQYEKEDKRLEFLKCDVGLQDFCIEKSISFGGQSEWKGIGARHTELLAAQVSKEYRYTGAVVKVEEGNRYGQDRIIVEKGDIREIVLNTDMLAAKEAGSGIQRSELPDTAVSRLNERTSALKDYIRTPDNFDLKSAFLKADINLLSVCATMNISINGNSVMQTKNSIEARRMELSVSTAKYEFRNIAGVEIRTEKSNKPGQDKVILEKGGISEPYFEKWMATPRDAGTGVLKDFPTGFDAILKERNQALKEYADTSLSTDKKISFYEKDYKFRELCYSNNISMNGEHITSHSLDERRMDLLEAKASKEFSLTGATISVEKNDKGPSKVIVSSGSIKEPYIDMNTVSAKDPGTGIAKTIQPEFGSILRERNDALREVIVDPGNTEKYTAFIDTDIRLKEYCSSANITINGESIYPRSIEARKTERFEAVVKDDVTKGGYSVTIKNVEGERGERYIKAVSADGSRQSILWDYGKGYLKENGKLQNRPITNVDTLEVIKNRNSKALEWVDRGDNRSHKKLEKAERNAMGHLSTSGAVVNGVDFTKLGENGKGNGTGRFTRFVTSAGVSSALLGFCVYRSGGTGYSLAQTAVTILGLGVAIGTLSALRSPAKHRNESVDRTYFNSINDHTFGVMIGIGGAVLTGAAGILMGPSMTVQASSSANAVTTCLNNPSVLSAMQVVMQGAAGAVFLKGASALFQMRMENTLEKTENVTVDRQKEINEPQNGDIEISSPQEIVNVDEKNQFSETDGEENVLDRNEVEDTVKNRSEDRDVDSTGKADKEEVLDLQDEESVEIGKDTESVDINDSDEERMDKASAQEGKTETDEYIEEETVDSGKEEILETGDVKEGEKESQEFTEKNIEETGNELVDIEEDRQNNAEKEDRSTDDEKMEAGEKEAIESGQLGGDEFEISETIETEDAMKKASDIDPEKEIQQDNIQAEDTVTDGFDISESETVEDTENDQDEKSISESDNFSMDNGNEIEKSRAKKEDADVDAVAVLAEIPEAVRDTERKEQDDSEKITGSEKMTGLSENEDDISTLRTADINTDMSAIDLEIPREEHSDRNSMEGYEDSGKEEKQEVQQELSLSEVFSEEFRSFIPDMINELSVGFGDFLDREITYLNEDGQSETLGIPEAIVQMAFNPEMSTENVADIMTEALKDYIQATDITTELVDSLSALIVETAGISEMINPEDFSMEEILEKIIPDGYLEKSMIMDHVGRIMDELDVHDTADYGMDLDSMFGLEWMTDLINEMSMVTADTMEMALGSVDMESSMYYINLELEAMNQAAEDANRDFLDHAQTVEIPASGQYVSDDALKDTIDNSGMEQFHDSSEKNAERYTDMDDHGQDVDSDWSDYL